MRRRVKFFGVDAACVFAGVLASIALAAEDEAAKLLTLRRGDLRVVIVDNGAYAPSHRRGYSGVAELSVGPEGRSVFVPSYSGLNFEHIFSGNASSYGWDIFEPRRSPMKLRRFGEYSVELHQERTQHWPLETTLLYTVAAPDAIDLTVRCTPRGDAWQKHGYIGLFFASYIQSPKNRGIHFIATRRGQQDAKPRWINHHSPRHGELASHAHQGGRDLAHDEGMPLTLVTGRSNYDYVYPFYYGLFHGKAVIFMFKQPARGGEVRFAQSPTGGGGRNPAWDFVLLQRRYQKDREFSFEMRLAYREFVDREDVIRVYEAWSGESVIRP